MTSDPPALNSSPNSSRNPEPVRSIDSVDAADLRQLLIASERQRRAAEESRRQAEAVLAGLQVLATASDLDELFTGILEILHEMVPYEAAAVLIETEADGLEIAATTDQNLPLTELAPDRFLNRVLDGNATVVADLERLPEWEAIAGRAGRLRSGLFVPLRSPDHRAVFVCLDGGIAAYSRGQLDLLVYLAPLAAQALQRYREMHQIDSMIDRLEDLAHHDTLTGLANRAVFTTQLQAAVDEYHDRGVAMAVLHIDLDDFKIVNDTLGHEAGDELIRTVAHRLTETTRSSDVVARLGGDEFAVLLTKLKRVGAAEQAAAKILQVLAEPVEIEGTTVRPQASIGISACPRDERRPEGLLGSADIALYDAKSAGGGQASTFSSEMRAARDHDLQLGGELRLGLERNELAVHYQPIMEVDSPEPIAFEALVRWNHPTLGLLPPSDFLPVAARNNLMGELGSFVLGTSLHELSGWLAAGDRRRVAVNVTAKQVLAPGFTDLIQSLLDRNGVPASALELELNEETVIPRNADPMMATLEELDRMGVGLAFDDFGTGYSSIAQLRRLPGHRLKIDRRFVIRLGTNASDLAVVKGMVDLARGLGMGVVAEGVEEGAQQAVLESLGCDELQGFHFGRPLPFDELGLDVASASDPSDPSEADAVTA